MSTCVYCKQEDTDKICISCDGKHSARSIFKRMKIERSSNERGWQNRTMDDYTLKQILIKREILGLEGLTKAGKETFFTAFNYEYNKLLGEVTR